MKYSLISLLVLAFLFSSCMIGKSENNEKAQEKVVDKNKPIFIELDSIIINIIDFMYYNDVSFKEHRNNLWVDFYKKENSTFVDLTFSYYYKKDYVSYKLYNECLVTFYCNDNEIDKTNIISTDNKKIPEKYLREDEVPKSPYEFVTLTYRIDSVNNSLIFINK